MGAERKILLKNNPWGQIVEYLLDHEAEVQRMVDNFSPASHRNEVILRGVEEGPLRLILRAHEHCSRDTKELIVYGGYQWLNHHSDTAVSMDNRMIAFLSSQIGFRG